MGKISGKWKFFDLTVPIGVVEYQHARGSGGIK
jgi:hypothetical protein